MEWIREMSEYSEWLWFQWNAHEWRHWLEYTNNGEPWPWRRWFEEMIERYPRGNDAQLGLVVMGKKAHLHTPLGKRTWYNHKNTLEALRKINGDFLAEEDHLFNGHWVNETDRDWSP